MPPSEKFLEQVFDQAILIALRAGWNITNSYRSFHRHDPTWTSPSHYKTVVDDMNDRLACTAIRAKFPDHNIWGEESGLLDQGSEYTWIVDGVDGTFCLIWDFADHTSFCIALYRDGNPVVGITNAARRGEFYYAEAYTGAFLNGVLLDPSEITDLAKVSMAVNSGKHHTDRLPPLIQKLNKAGVNCGLGTNCASVPIAMVASGVIPAYAATSLEPEDMAAGVVLNREVGNVVTNLKGEPWTPFVREGGKLIPTDEGILIANPILHAKLLEVILN
ncbi:MAG: inositol monophosphatase family protein [bacterium]|nr:inositol monophosphatase family protein [bacterium]